MRKFILPLVALALPAAAYAQEPVRFTQDGASYEYVVTDRPDGSRLIQGRNLTTSQDFLLKVRAGRVTGTVGGSSVAFEVPAARSAEALASK